MTEPPAPAQDPQPTSDPAAAPSDQWFAPADDERPAEFDRISAEVDQLAGALAGAEPQKVGDELADLHERADTIDDPEWRDQAHTRVDELPQQVSDAEQANEPAASDAEPR